MCKAWKLKLLLLFHLLLFLTQDSFVDSGSVVTHLPGFEGPLPFHLETGYIGVGEEENIQLFYYFVKSEKNAEEDPLMIWLTGGPACSALSALGFEIGPFTIDTDVYNGSLPSLISTSYSWTKEASIIFLDQPVGAGFSYSTTPIDDNPSDTGEAKQTDEFLRKWLVEYPEFTSNPFYVGGNSHSGITVPAIVQHISLGNEHGYKPLINLKGYVLGNPVTHYEQERNSKIPYAHGMGLISDELYESLVTSCKGNYFNIDPTNTQCLTLMEDYVMCVSRIDKFHILEPDCGLESHDPLIKCYMYSLTLAEYWANDEDVRKALHVVKGSIGKWKRCNWGMAYEKDIKNSVPYHRNNSIKGTYRSLIYSGDHDLMITFLGTQAWIRSLNYSVIDEWRPWFVQNKFLDTQEFMPTIESKVLSSIYSGDHDTINVPFLGEQAWIKSLNYSITDEWRPSSDNNQVLGYTRTYANNMTFATVKGGGHTANYKPDESFLMFKKWIRGQSL